MKKSVQLVIVAVLWVLACVLGIFIGAGLQKDKMTASESEPTAPQQEVTAPSVGENQMPVEVSVIQLIANPEKYHGKTVRVIGVGNLEFEGNCISLSKEDLYYGVGNSIWIELGEGAPSYQQAQQYNGEYVIVEGVFDKDDCGHFDMFHGSIKNISRYDLWDVYKIYDPYTMYTITQNEDLTYSYKIVDRNGAVLFAKDSVTREPEVERVNSYVLGLTVQTGTGLSTNWAVYCDVENSKVSEIFQYVLMAQGDYVIYTKLENGKHSIVVQNIFDKSEYYKEYPLSDCAPVAGDVVIGGKPNGTGKAIVTYLTGDDYTQTEISITFP